MGMRSRTAPSLHSRSPIGLWPRGGLAILLLLGLLVSAGCATPPQTRALAEAPPPDLSPALLLEDVPFHSQSAYQCGPAALAMVLNHIDVATTPEELVPEVYVPARRGAFQVELQAATRNHGRLALAIRPGLVNLLQWLASGRPVLVLQNLGLSWYPKWHFAVAMGYDLHSGELILHSGETAGYRVPLSTFERTWARGGFWGMVALMPGDLPRREDPARYFRAAAALEETQPLGKLRPVWETGAEAWPDSPDLAMGLANHLYRSGERDRARHHYASVVARHPEYLPAYNNLATAQLEAGLVEQAIATATLGLEQAGGHHAFLEETLAGAKSASEQAAR